MNPESATLSTPRMAPATGDSTGVRNLVIEIARQAHPAAVTALQRAGRQLGIELREHDRAWAHFLVGRLPDPLHVLGRRLGDSGNDPWTNPLDHRIWLDMPGVSRAFTQEEDYVLAGRAWQADDSRVQIGDRVVGAGRLAIIAGPCSVEDREQMLEIAAAVREAGAEWLRGGAFKPRTSPYSFQGLGPRGLEFLREAAERTGLGIITEVISPEDVPLVSRYSDVLQVGARNAQNFALLERLGESGKPILLKRGFGCTLNEFMLSAEHLLSHGNPDVLLCERGIRSFETTTRFTFDINAIPLLKRQVHLPVIADPSHGTGDAGLVAAVARAAVAAGADGVMIEVHPEPARARSDGRQSLTLEQFAQLMQELRAVAGAVGRSV